MEKLTQETVLILVGKINAKDEITQGEVNALIDYLWEETVALNKRIAVLEKRCEKLENEAAKAKIRRATVKLK